jgi:glucose-6-phosphate isomerase, archaeal
MAFDPGIGVTPLTQSLGFSYGPNTFGPQPELRSLHAIRPSLRDPQSSGPDPVYAIAMDIGRNENRDQLQEHMLLFGAVTYAAGRLGDEPVRSQGHVHRISSHSGWSPPEVYEIWSGTACVYMQERAADDPGRCFAITAGPGTLIVVPPGWAHATISADPSTPMTFGALCDREYGFEYAEVRKRKGLAWYPLLTESAEIRWQPNPMYKTTQLEARGPVDYSQLGLRSGIPLYTQTILSLDRFQWVSRPALAADIWKHFVP